MKRRSPADWATLLKADIAREWAAAERYLRLPGVAEGRRQATVRRQAAVCAAASLVNVNLLAAEVLALGCALPERLLRACPFAVSSAPPRIDDPRRELDHYHRRLVWARRAGMPRLEQVFWQIVWGKRNHLAHAAALHPKR